jgi:hypothetical protein
LKEILNGEKNNSELIDLGSFKLNVTERKQIEKHKMHNPLYLYFPLHMPDRNEKSVSRLISGCFIVKDNGTLTPQPSNITIKFQQLYNATQNCFNKFYNVTTKKYESAVCANCTEKYCTLNKYYEDLKADTGEGIVCMDIVDAVSIIIILLFLYTMLVYCYEMDY